MTNLFQTNSRNSKGVKNWQTTFKFNSTGLPFEEIVSNVKSLEENAIFANILILVTATRNLKVQYISKNVQKILGYSQSDILNAESSKLSEIRSIDQKSYFSDLVKFGSNFITKSPHKNEKALLRGFYCGNRWQRKNGSTVRFLVRLEIINNCNKLPPYTITYYEDVTHLLKGSEYWVYYESVSKNGSYSQFYTKDGKETRPITTREAEILKLIAIGKSTKEVAEELFISPETVSQHRKNMIRKTLAKDTSSLVQLCKTCGII